MGQRAPLSHMRVGPVTRGNRSCDAAEFRAVSCSLRAPRPFTEEA